MNNTLKKILNNIFKKGKTINTEEKNNDESLTIDIATQLNTLYQTIQNQQQDDTKKNRKYLILRLKDQSAARNCSVDNLPLFITRLKERDTTIGYELTTGWIINDSQEDELISKIIIKINDNENIKLDYQKEIEIPGFDETIKAIEMLIKYTYNKKVEVNSILRNQSKRIISLKNYDYIRIKLFNKEKNVEVFSIGDNKIDENGNYKENDFKLNDKEIEYLNWFVENIKIEDYQKEILAYCNNIYDEVGEPQITEEDLENEIHIHAIAINIREELSEQDNIYIPDISFYGDCQCDEEHGICIGFKNKKFLGIKSQDWTL